MNQPLAYVHPGAKIAKNVVIEPFATIHNNVTIGEGSWIGSNVTIMEGARIGKNCNIFPGAVISAPPQDLKYQGEETTVEIGNNVTIYQCVTLGGSNPTNGVPGKRHPTIRDNVIIGSGAQIIGPITVGDRARVGANAVVTDDVPEGATMIGLKARSTLVKAETWAKEFMPYGTPCEEPCEPGNQRIESLEEQIATLRQQVDALLAEREALNPKAQIVREGK